MEAITLRGALHVVAFIGDHSTKVWAFTLKTKDRVLEAFRQFHDSIDRHTKRKLKAAWADNSEYRDPFEKNCRHHGIRLCA